MVSAPSISSPTVFDTRSTKIPTIDANTIVYMAITSAGLKFNFRIKKAFTKFSIRIITIVAGKKTRIRRARVDVPVKERTGRHTEPDVAINAMPRHTKAHAVVTAI